MRNTVTENSIVTVRVYRADKHPMNGVQVDHGRIVSMRRNYAKNETISNIIAGLQNSNTHKPEKHAVIFTLAD